VRSVACQWLVPSDQNKQPSPLVTFLARAVRISGFLHPLGAATRVMFRWPEHIGTVILAYALVFLGVPALCALSYFWVTGRI
jgi:hypothetical protein